MPSANSEALRLAEASDWKGLQRLVEKHPAAAREAGEYGMLPIHWACTERHVPLALLARLLAAHPDGARARNAADLLPLHIAIRAGAQAAWLAKLVRAFPQAVHAATPGGATALELAEQMQLDADKLAVLRRESSPSTASFASDTDNNRDEEREREPSASSDAELLERKQRGVSDRDSTSNNNNSEFSDNGNPLWPSPPEHYVGNGAAGGGGHLLSAATELSDEEEPRSPSASSSSLSEDAVRLSASRDHLISPSSLSSSSNQFSPPSSASAPVPLMPALTDQISVASSIQARRKHARGRSERFPPGRVDNMRSVTTGATAVGQEEDRDLRSMVSTSMGGRHQSLPIIPSFGSARRNSIGGAFPADHGGFGSGSDDSDPNADESGAFRRHTHYYTTSSRSTATEFAPPPSMADNPRAFQTQPHPQRQRHHSPFTTAYRRASHGEVVTTGGGNGGGTGNGRRHFESPPEWKLDDECAICRVTFNMFKHRHHCRNCGKSICRQHSADKKILMEAKGFTTPQRVCVTCYAMIVHSRSLKHDLALDDLSSNSLLNPIAFQQQHYAGQTLGSSAGASIAAAGGGGGSSAATAPVTASALRSFASTAMSSGARKSSLRSSAEAGGGNSPLDGGSSGIAATTMGMLAPASTAAPAQSSSGNMGGLAMSMEPAGSKEFALMAQIHELRVLLSSQQKQIETLAQSNMQMQHQLLEQEELKAETTLLITQLMTRVSMLELRRGHEDEEDEGDARNEDKPRLSSGHTEHEHDEHEREDEEPSLGAERCE